MRIAIIGGTGDLGRGLTYRFAVGTDHQIVVGSRTPEKARSQVNEYQSELSTDDIEHDIVGEDNADAIVDADVAVLSVPPYFVRDTLQNLSHHLTDNTIVVSPCVGMDSSDAGMHYDPPNVGSVTELVMREAPSDVPVVGAFHTLPAKRLADLDTDIGMDVPVVGDDAIARNAISDLVSELPGLRPVDVGPAENAREVEALTPLIINVSRYTVDAHDVGVRFDWES